MRFDKLKKQFHPRYQSGFTLVEMIAVITITGILASGIAVMIAGPIQGYVDSGYRAEVTNVADTAMRRIIRDLRTALPNSVRVTVTANCGGAGITCSTIEFLPTSGGGRYFSAGDCTAGCTGNMLNIATPTTTFDVLGAMPASMAASSVVVDNIGTTATNTGMNPAGANAYDAGATNVALVASTLGNTVTLNAAATFPVTSPGRRFQVINKPVTYQCSIPASGLGGTLKRYGGYTSTPSQPTDPTIAPLLGTPSSGVLASNLSACSFPYNYNVSSTLVPIKMTIVENGNSINLSDSAYIANTP